MGYGLNRWARLLFAIVFASAFFALYEKASAATLTLTQELAENSQQSVDNPCIISGTSCLGKQPAGFPYNDFVQGGISSFDEESPEYTVAQIRSVVGNSFVVGLDVNEANAAQTLDLFEVWIAGTLIAYTGTSTGNVPATNNGSGYADYIISGIPSLAGFAEDALVQFRAVMSGLNDGHEQFFLISTVPIPAALPLFGAALVGMGLYGRRRRRAVA